MKVAIYLRVSKSREEEQNPENQKVPLVKLAEALEGEIYNIYLDRVTGGTSNRPQFQEMLDDASKRKFDLILIWSLDRFSREGILQTMNYIARLRSYGVALKSLKDPWLDTQQEGVSDLILAVMSWASKDERKRIKERTDARLSQMKEQIKKKGYAITREGKKIKRLGRPPGSKDKTRRRKAGYLKRWASKRGEL